MPDINVHVLLVCVDMCHTSLIRRDRIAPCDMVQLAMSSLVPVFALILRQKEKKKDFRCFGQSTRHQCPCIISSVCKKLFAKTHPRQKA